MDSKLYKGALYYTKRSWSIFPLHYVKHAKCSCNNAACSNIAKHPLTPNGFKDATTQLDKITEWWTQHPKANIGIVTGQISGVVVIDIDIKNNGFDSLEKLEARYGKLPATITVTTGGGGKHYYFKHPNRILKNAVNIMSGIDFRGDGGYIVAPPSTHASGNLYEWDNTELLKKGFIADIPEWFIDLLTKHSCSVVPGMHGEQENKQNNEIPTGQRNNTLTSLAGSMHHRGMSKEAIREALCKENQLKCTPPLSSNEIDIIVNSVSRYEVKELAIKKNFILTKLSDLIAEPEEEISYIVEGLLPSAGISLFAGKPKAGKTTLARDLALCIAQGKDFLNRTVIKGSVIYLALEEKRSEVKRHFEDMGVIGDEEIYIHAASAPQNAIAELNELARIHTPRLIIVDPLFRFISVRDGNDYASVTKALEPLVNLARATKSHIMCVHHLGKGERSGADAILGSTAIRAAVDTSLMLRRTDKYRIIWSEQRYGTDLEESVIDFDPNTRTSKISGTKYEAENNRIGKDICDYLSRQKEPVSEKDIKENVEGANAYRVKTLRNLVDAGKVIREGKGGKGDPYHYSCSLVPNIYSEQQNKQKLSPNLTEEQRILFEERAGILEHECNLPREEAEKQALSEVINNE